MTVEVGDKVPEATMKVMGDKGPQDLTTEELFGGKKVVLFAVPGAFTPTCSAAHLPGFVVNADKIKEKGVDSIVCLAVNDAFVMDAWSKDKNAEELIMAADGNGDFTFSNVQEVKIVTSYQIVKDQDEQGIPVSKHWSTFSKCWSTDKPVDTQKSIFSNIF